jgi:hypothetical protein
MKKQTFMLCTCCMAISLVQLVSCVKPPKDFDPRDGNNEFNNCRIKRITRADGVTFDFVYNSKGDPVSVTPSHISSGQPKKAFLYDKKGRLSKYISPYDDDRYETLHSYVYDNFNRVTIDSDFVFGQLSLPGQALGLSVQYLSYDKLNRVTADSVINVRPITFTYVQHYEYNAAGNRTLFSPTYDDKLNFHRTNKIWMFVDRDYSVNNPATADSYSFFRLPLSFTDDDVNFLGYGIGTSKIEYDCKY